MEARPMTEAPLNPHRVVIVGAGFGGLEAAFGLAGAPVEITVIDRRNHHLFQPLLYQVATASLATSEIAWPIRYLLRDRPEVTTLFATVNGVDVAARHVQLEDGGSVPYDTLILATGARHAYFGHDEWEPFAPGLKTLEDATTLRRRILVAFERAERETDPDRCAALLTFVIVGAGPTGVEMAGTIADLARDTLPRDFRHIDTRRARVVLIEAGPRVLAGFPDDLSAYAQRALEKLGVEVMLGEAVTEGTAEGQDAAAVPLQARRQPGADRQPARRDRLRQGDQAARRHRVVDLGYRPHLFPDRPAQPARRRLELVVGLFARPTPGAADHARQQQSNQLNARLDVSAAAAKVRRPRTNTRVETWRGGSDAKLFDRCARLGLDCRGRGDDVIQRG